MADLPARGTKIRERIAHIREIQAQAAKLLAELEAIAILYEHGVDPKDIASFRRTPADEVVTLKDGSTVRVPHGTMPKANPPR